MDAGPPSTSIFVFQQKESLAGFAERCGRLSEKEFLARHPDPFLLTSMPTDVTHAAWTFVIPVSRKPIKISLSDEIKTPSARVFLGRGPECDIVLAPKSISRKHAVFEKKADLWNFVDLGSTNGSRIEGKVLAPRTPISIRSSPVKLELGSDVTLWFFLPEDVFTFVSHFAQQLSDTSQSRLPAVGVGGDTAVTNPKKKDNSTPVENSFLAHLPPDATRSISERMKIAEAETGPLIRPKDLTSTWSDEDTEEPAREAARESRPTPVSAPQPRDLPKRMSESDERLDAAITAITALDYLITSVSVKFKSDDRVMMIFSAQAKTKEKVTDVPDHLRRLEPFMKSVIVTLSTAEGQPVEIYSAE